MMVGLQDVTIGQVSGIIAAAAFGSDFSFLLVLLTI